MIKVISFRATFFVDRNFSPEKDLFEIIPIAKDYNLYPFLAPSLNDKDKLVINLTRKADTFRVTASDNRLDVTKSLSGDAEQLISEEDFKKIAIELVNKIINIFQCNYTRFAFAPEYIIEGVNEDYNKIYLANFRGDEIPIEWYSGRIWKRDVEGMSLNIVKTLQKKAIKLGFEEKATSRVICAFDINTDATKQYTKAEIEHFWAIAMQLINQEKESLNK